VVADQEIYGDGGQSGFSSANDALRFNTFTGQANDAGPFFGRTEKLGLTHGAQSVPSSSASCMAPGVAARHPTIAALPLEPQETNRRDFDSH
jgi:hypothetical protein